MTGVVILLVMHVVITLASFSIDKPATGKSDAAAAVTTGRDQLGLLLDIWVLPIVLVFVVYWICKRHSLGLSLQNILWVMVWSQLPVMLLTLISIPMELSGMAISVPLFSNKLITGDGLLLLDPPVLQLNFDSVFYFVVSTVLLLWSFQILLSGVSAVTGATVKRALWFVTLAMIALMLIRLPFTLMLGDRDLMDLLGLKGILEI